MKRAAGTALLLALVATPLAAQQWTLFGSNEITLETYEVGGSNPDASPFRLEGTFITNRLDFGLESEADGRTILLTGELLGTNSDYFVDQGLVLGFLSLRIEDGTHAMPYRLAAGDLTADLTRRTLLRQVRGVSVELQPELGGGSHSIVIVGGGGEPEWRDAFENDLAFAGLSWLWAPRETISFSANVVDARQDAGAEGAVPIPFARRRQRIGSVASSAEVGGIVIDAEVALLEGELGATDTDDLSLFGQIARTEGPLSWRVRFEQNGEEFVPIGGVGILPNRRTLEGEGRWEAGPRSTFRARVQHLDADFEGEGVERDSDFLSLSWDGRPLRARSTLQLRAAANFDAFDAEDGSVDRTYAGLSLEARDRWRGLDLQGTLRLADLDDDRVAIANREQREATLRAGRSFRARGFTSRVGAALTWRDQDGTGAYRVWNPLLDASLRRDAHSLSIHLALTDQTFDAPSAGDLEYQTRRIVYSWTRAPHTLVVEGGEELRERELAGDTDSMRLAVRYRRTFSRSVSW